MCCAGVTTSQASQPSRSARSLVAEIEGDERDFRKEDGVAMLGVDRDHDLLFQRPQQSIAAVRSNRLRQRGAPGAAADHREALDLHALTPAPRTFSALSSSGQRARAGASSWSTSPAASRSTPAQAIIAALSVHSQAGGTLKRRPSSRGEPAKRRADRLVGGDPAGDDQRRRVGLAQRERGAVDQAIDDGLLEARGNVLATIVARDDRALDRALEAGEGEMRLG